MEIFALCGQRKERSAEDSAVFKSLSLDQGKEEDRRVYRMPEIACRSFLGPPFDFRGLSHTRKSPEPTARGFFWCERWDSNPHGVTTRTSNVLVYHSNTLANAWLLYSGGGDLSTVFFCAELQKIRKNFVFVL